MMNKVMIERFIGRELTNEERKTVEWVSGFDRDTGLNLMGLIIAANEKGFAEGVKARTPA